MISPLLRRELLGIALSLLAVFLLGALLFPGSVSAESCGDAGGLFGPVGSCIARSLVYLIGLPAAIIAAVTPAAYAVQLFRRSESERSRSWYLFLGGLVLLLPVIIALPNAVEPAAGSGHGIWGSFLAYYAARTLGRAGAWIFVVLLFSGLTAATLAWNPIRMIIGSVGRRPADDTRSDSKPLIVTRPDADQVDEVVAPQPVAAVTPSGGELEAAPPNARERSRRRRTRPGGPDDPTEQIEIPAPGSEAGEPPDIESELPSPELLTAAPPTHAEVGRRELEQMGEKLMQALRTFKVDGELVGRTTGPVVTQFEIAPAAGVKVRQIANLANDLALAMRASSIRIVAPIPGRGVVGVEVPNPTADLVSFRELIEAREFTASRGALPIALGKDLEGKPLIADLSKMPHLLIAGATGSGKSVCINTLITSLVYRHTPRTLRFLMIDPKMVELSVYNVLPHLRHKVVTDNRDAAAALKWAVLEMKDRYELLAANGARNLAEFNKRVQDGAQLKLPKRENVAFEELTYRGGVLPYIVVVIDELADLMMTVQGEVETPLAMLAQKARAIGIHLILATQRPSVNVITGLIKANFPSRIAFRVASQVDSRTIIDGIGAESLLGNGDMLFIPPGKSEPWRLQGAFISSEDTERLTGWYTDARERKRAALESRGLIVPDPRTGEEDILERVRQSEAAEEQSGEGESGGSESRDVLFREAGEIVIQHQQGSTSLLQRRLEIGYGRAARIIDQLHAAGVLGGPNGSKPREVLVGLAELDRIAGRR